MLMSERPIIFCEGAAPYILPQSGTIRQDKVDHAMLGFHQITRPLQDRFEQRLDLRTVQQPERGLVQSG